MFLDSLKEVLIKYLIGLKKFLKEMLINTCHLSTISKTPVGYELSGITIMSEENVKRLGIYIDNRLNFD